ncbi:Uma2 family endonuclease [Streptomyces sp. NPDC050548]|uniref:Uma2 family endonuclease n=1 Tax=Streptomyces sp. NPDC050548 TaxID=3365629 RepID=UPI00379C885C
MSTHPQPDDRYADIDHERALKHAIRYVADSRVQIIQGIIQPVPPTWDYERTTRAIRRQIEDRVDELGCVAGSGDIDLPGSPNWYVPDIAVVPEGLARDDNFVVTPDLTFWRSVTSKSNADTDRVTKRKRYAEYGAPLYLLIDRQNRELTLFSEPGGLGYTEADGPHPLGTPVTLPEPFGIVLDTTRL